MPRSDLPVVRPPLTRRDVAVAAGYGALVLLLAASGVTNSGFLGHVVTWPLGVSVAVLLVASAATAWRHRAPAVTLVVTGLASLADVLVGGQVTGFILLFDAVFVPVMFGSRRLARVTTALAAALTVLGLLLAATLSGAAEYVLVIVMVCGLVLLTPLMWGWEVRHHRGARETAEALRAAEQELAEARSVHAVEQERRRIAHDLHDVIAGHLSAVTLHTGLASSLADGAGREQSLVTARESARAALRDLQSMIGVLATEEAGRLPVATLDWGVLAERLRGRDSAARIEIDDAVTDPARVDPSTQAALLRIAAEAVTNAVRHGAAPISLVVGGRGEEVSLVLENALGTVVDPGSGVGRGAIEHRARAVGGAASSGPSVAVPGPAGDRAETGRPDRWRVEARLPSRPLSPVAGQEATS